MKLVDEMLGVKAWIAEYFNEIDEKTGGRGAKAIIGLSGGVDSSVVAALCASPEALGTHRCLGVIMPCDSLYQDTFDAIEVAKKLDIKFVVIDLETTMRAWWDGYRNQTFAAVDAGELPDLNHLVLANAKSRLRMTTLYGLANQTSGIVVGTTNKSEMVIGYATKYGDGGVDIEPIADFYKTEIWEMAAHLDIPQKIIDKKPSAGLWMGQTDEGELGISYEELDRWHQIMQSGSNDNSKARTYIEKLMKAAGHKNMHLPYYNRDA